MFYIDKISGNNINIIDTSDNAVDTFDKESLISVLKDNPDLIIKGVGITMDNSGIKFRFAEYKLTDNDILRLSGAKPPVCKFIRLPNESSPRNHYYYCHNCGKLLDNKQATCKCGAKFIYQNSIGGSKNYTTDSNGKRFYFMSVNGARSMFRDRILRG